MNPVYRHYTAEQLQQQYSARNAVPDHAAIFNRWQEDSAAYRAEASATLDIPYGPSPRQTLDLFLPRESHITPPLFIFIHGGYWQAMDKSFSSFIARELNLQGAAVAVLNHELCPAVDLTEITRQIQCAILWLWQHGQAHGFDHESLHLCGHSAGGHLTAAMMATDWAARYPAFDSRVIRSGLSISGVFELEPLIHTGINQALQLDIASAQRNSPLLMVPRLRIPLELLVGGDETAEFHRQSQALAERWKTQGIATHYQSLAGLNHFAIIDQFTDPDSTLLDYAFNAMGLLREDD